MIKSVTQIARDLGVQPYRVRYVIRTRKVKATTELGTARGYSAEAVERIRRGLRAATKYRTGVRR